jgi:hypothetical protein
MDAGVGTLATVDSNTGATAALFLTRWKIHPPIIKPATKQEPSTAINAR